MVFRDRTAAGRVLAETLASVVPGSAVVAAIPRGGVTVAMPIVARLHLPLTVVYARKLTASFAPELAFGALDEDGHAMTEPDTVDMLGLSPGDVEHARARVGAEIRRRMALYRVPPLSHYLPGREVVLVDDGLATGLTMRAALEYARRHGAARVTVAVPCAAGPAAAHFRRAADRFVSPVVDEAFVAVGAYYRDFSAVSDEEVVAMLGEARALVEEAAAPAAATGATDQAAPPASDPGLLIAFKNARGLRLAGELLVPSGEGPHPVVVFAHGWGSSKASPRNRAVAEALGAAGVAAFLFDFTGHGESEGEPEDSTAAQQIDDLHAAVRVLAGLDEVDTGRLGLAGASSGAVAALHVAAEHAGVRALALRSANAAGAMAAGAHVRVPTLLVVGEHDAPIRSLNEELLSVLAGPKRLAVVRGGDHLFEDPAALREAITLTVGWLAGHLR